jgi:hypothetical protein
MSDNDRDVKEERFWHSALEVEGWGLGKATEPPIIIPSFRTEFNIPPPPDILLALSKYSIHLTRDNSYEKVTY